MPPPVKATTSTSSSVAMVTSAMAADASRAVMGIPAIEPQPIEPDTSSAMRVRLPDGSTLPKAA